MKRLLCTLALAWLAGCATSPTAPRDWERRLTGDHVVLLGEVHDNPTLHRLRLEALQRAIERGWRPTLAMEQFDVDRQADLDRARRESPGDVDRLIASAVPAKNGWDWRLYRPVLALALQYELPLLAANLPNADTSRIVREGESRVIDEARRMQLGLDREIATDWQSAQQREIAEGHCGMLPERLLPAMARAQFARDAVMADVLRGHAGHGIVLLAGNGHARRDLGVPRWLVALPASRVVAIGFLERPVDADLARGFDAVVEAAPAQREDPCEAFRKQ